MQAVLLATSVCAMPAQAQDTATKAGPASVTDTSETAALRDSSVVLEEEALPETRGEGAERDSLLLEPVIVTATKRPMALREVPASIGVISGAALEQAGALELRDFLGRIPGVQQTEVFTEYNRISVRGIQSDAAAVTPAATGYFVDDVPFSDPFILHARPDVPPFDLDAVEMLKGPQGTLHGASALAGALRYRLTDAKPGVNETHGFLQSQYQEDGLPNRAGGIASNLALGEDVGLRLVGTSRLGGGRIDDLRSGEQDTDSSRRYSGRLLLRWDNGERWSAGIKGISQRSAADDVPVAETTDGRLERERALRKAPTHARFNFASLDAIYRSPVGDLVWVSSAVDKNGFLSGENGARGLGLEDAGQPVATPVRESVQGFVQELRLVSSSSASPWQWLAGLYAHRYADYTTQQVLTTEANTGAEVVLLDFVADITAREQAVFGELSRALGSRWRLTGGLRGYQIETAGEVVSTGAIILATGSTENRNDARISASGLSPKLALQFMPSEQFQTYLSVSRGFRFGGIQIVGPSPVAPDVPETYKPDSLWNYELGWRSLWLRETLSIDGSVFYLDWKDPQLQTTTGGAVPLNIVDNIGHARSQGAELQIGFRPSPGRFRLYLAAAYTDARSTEAYTTPSGDEAQAGARLPGTAHHQFSAGLEYRWQLLGSQFMLTVDHQQQGPGVSDILQSLPIYDYHSTDVRLHLASRRWLGNSRLSLGVSNLADQRAVTQALVLSETNFTTTYNNTRMVDLRLSFEL